MGLNVVQKAAAYDKALGAVIALQKANPSDEVIQNWVNENFPELKESKESDDERIRKALINVFATHKDYEVFFGVSVEDICAWLEKRGEQKSIIEMKSAEESLGIDSEIYNEIVDECIYGEQKNNDKVKPNFNFNVGQWIVATGKCTYLITKIDGFNVTLVDVNDNEYVFDASSLEDAHLWNIQDAKDGDVLSYRNEQWIFIYKKQIDNSSFHYYSLYSTIHQDLTIDDSAFTILIDEIVPATKEQRDLLFQKMREAGYQWDPETKGPKKVSKFHEGEWVVCDVTGLTCQIKGCVENISNHKFGYFVDSGYINSDVAKHYHLWTIQDAKDGDVLASKDGGDILIFRNLDTNISFSSYCNIARKGELGWSNSRFIPATKKQRDLLFQKIKEEGYEWDAEKKELKKIPIC